MRIRLLKKSAKQYEFSETSFDVAVTKSILHVLENWIHMRSYYIHDSSALYSVNLALNASRGEFLMVFL